VRNTLSICNAGGTLGKGLLVSQPWRVLRTAIPVATRCDQWKTDRVEMQVGILRADVTKDAGNCVGGPYCLTLFAAPQTWLTRAA
jgi:hypothetical protein